MFELALKAGIPIIGVQTDDPVNVGVVLDKLAGKPAIQVPSPWNLSKVQSEVLYWTGDPAIVNTETYRTLQQKNAQLIVVNALAPSNLIFEGGQLPVPVELVKQFLNAMNASNIDGLAAVVRGLSLKAIGEASALTMARTGSLTPHELRRTRSELSGGTQGLFAVDTTYDFYQFPPDLMDWLHLNAPYFVGQAHAKLVPRGVLLDGTPGVGKSLAAKAIANHLGLPLYRLDIATTLNKYIGQSEAQVARILGMVEREAPCVLLVDEVEKIFVADMDSGVTQRILSQLLWWLAEHQSRVFTVMTTNAISKIPPELYREGRIDRVLKIPRMTKFEAKMFSMNVYASVLGQKASLDRVQSIANDLTNTGQDDFSHAEVSQIVYNAIKRYNW